METPSEEAHERATIDRTINDQLNHEAKGMKIPMDHDRWSWMPHSIGPSYPTRKENEEGKRNFASHVESRAT